MAKQNQSIHQNIQKEFGRFQQMVSALETRSNDIQSELGMRITTIDDGLHKWKKDFTTNNEQRMIELQNAIKQTITYTGKINEESKARDQLIGQDLKSLQKQFTASLNEMRSKIQGDDLHLQERVSKMSTHLFEKLSQTVAQKQASLSTLASSLSQKVKSESYQQIKQLQGKIGKMVERLRSQLSQDSNQRSIMIAGEAQAFTLGIEKRLKGQLNNLADMASKLKSQLHHTTKKHQAELERQVKSRIDNDASIKNELVGKIQESKKLLSGQMRQGDENIFKCSENSINSLKDQVNSSIAASILESKNQRKKLSQQKTSEIQASSKKLSFQITQKIADQHREMISKYNELNKLYEIYKKVVDETISRHIEAVKALTKALITEQKAERQAKNQEILHLTNSRLDKVQLALNNAIESRAQEMKAQIKLQRDAFQAKLSSIDLNTKKELNQMSQNLEVFKVENGQIIQKLSGRADRFNEQINELFEGQSAIKDETNKQTLRLDEQIRQTNIKSLVSQMVDRISIQNEIKQTNLAIQRDLTEKLSERADHLHEQINELSQGQSAIIAEINKQTLRLNEQIRQTNVKSLVSQMIERISNQNEIQQNNNAIQRELMVSEGRIEQVRQLMQNNIDHAMNKILGQQNDSAQGEDNFGEGLKGKILRVDEKIQALSNQVDQKLNTWDFKILQIDQKVIKIEEDQKKSSSQSLEKEEQQGKIVEQIDKIKQELKGFCQIQKYENKLKEVESRIQNLQDQIPQGPPSNE